jgi:predicted phosphodiesterase
MQHDKGHRWCTQKLRTENVDVLVVAGDLTTHTYLEQRISELCDRFKHVVYVPGNHEFYGTTFPSVEKTLTYLRGIVKNFHYLNGNRVVIDGQGFVGATLWFQDPANLVDPHIAEMRKRKLNDFWIIHDFEKHVYFKHEWDSRNIRDQCRPGDVVVTHHTPSFKSCDPKYEGEPTNIFFHNDMEETIEAKQPALWIHGHTHSSVDYVHDKTRVICNPLGYVGYDTNGRFDKNLLFEVENGSVRKLGSGPPEKRNQQVEERD